MCLRLAIVLSCGRQCTQLWMRLFGLCCRCPQRNGCPQSSENQIRPGILFEVSFHNWKKQCTYRTCWTDPRLLRVSTTFPAQTHVRVLVGAFHGFSCILMVLQGFPKSFMLSLVDLMIDSSNCFSKYLFRIRQYAMVLSITWDFCSQRSSFSDIWILQLCSPILW